ncbi:MAG: metallopeptidase TldD-related protein, partial [Candidatus Angelobacter sp.]
MRRFIPAVVFIFVAFLPGLSQAAKADGSAADAKVTVSADDHGDPVLKAMLAELRRSQEKLQLGQLQRPYYIDYQVTELQDYIADATLGALRTDTTNVGRLVRVVVRIGDYKQDSYYGEGVGTLEMMPIENNEIALRHQLWLATDKAYKAALNGLTEKQ